MVTELWSGSQGRICEAYLDRLTNSSPPARWALEYGDARLDDVPEELRSDKAAGERAKWLESRLSDGAKAMLRERSARGLPVGPRSDSSARTGRYPHLPVRRPPRVPMQTHPPSHLPTDAPFVPNDLKLDPATVAPSGLTTGNAITAAYSPRRVP